MTRFATHPLTTPAAEPRAGTHLALATRPPAPIRPDVARLARSIARWYVEHRSGLRPGTQLWRLATPALRRRLCSRVVPRRGCVRVQVRSVVVQWPTPTAAEATVLLAEPGGRTTALAMRMEHVEGRWLLSDLAAPHEALRPLPRAAAQYAEHREAASATATLRPPAGAVGLPDAS